MSVTIRVCSKNRWAGKVFKKIKDNHPAIDAKQKECIKKCGPCKKAPFAVINGETVTAEDSDKLYEKVIHAINESESHS